MAIEKLKTTTLRQQVYDQLRAKILGAEILPGEVISLRSLAEQFGVSLLPVREAVWQLESEKILIVESNRRIQVNQLTKSEFQEVLNLRLLLESEAVDKACQHRSAADVHKVERILAGMKKYIGSNPKAYIRKNDEFHAAIYACAGSPLLMEMIRRLLARVNPYLFLYAVQGRVQSSALECHNEIFAGFATGDSDRTIAALRKDLTGAASVIIDHLADGRETRA